MIKIFWPKVLGNVIMKNTKGATMAASFDIRM